MKISRTKISELHFDERESILYIKIFDGAEMNLANTVEHYNKINDLTQGNPYGALIDATCYFEAHPDALKYAALPENFKGRIASAHYNSELANKLTTQFFVTNYKPSIQVNLFKTREEALHWIKGQIKAYNEYKPKQDKFLKKGH